MYNPKIDELTAQSFGIDAIPVAKLEQRTLIALVNINPVIDYSAPLPQNVIPVGGLHIGQINALPNVCTK